MIRGIDHIQLAMPEGQEELARGFYSDVLGLTEVEKPEMLKPRGGCWFRGAVEIHLGVEPDFRPARKAHPALVVEDLLDCAERLRSAGCPVEPDDSIPGIARFYTADPFGNRIEIVEILKH